MKRSPWSVNTIIAAVVAGLMLAAAPIVAASPQKGSKQTKGDTVTQNVKEENPVVLMSTSLGDIKIRLFADKAPLTVKNFLAYVDSGFYAGTVFHRVISNFMIQGGGMTADLERKETNPPIKNEADNGLSNKRGTIAMARTGVVDSATSQFFINVVDNSMLDHRGPSPRTYGYAVFGEVIDGMDVVDKIRNVKTTTKGSYADVPVTPVVIESVKRVKPETEK